MRVIRLPLFLLGIYALSVLAMAAPAAAQSPNPDIDIQCSPSNIPIDVYPGSTRVGITYCTATNPTGYSETVRITITSGGLAFAGPGSVTVGATSSITFEVTVRGDLRMPETTRVVSIAGTVETFNGAPNPNPVQKTANVMVVVKQFSRLQVEASEPFKQLRPKVDYYFEFKVYNQGNALDKFNIEVANRDELEEAGFQISLPLISTEIDAQAPAQKVNVLTRTPKIQGWTDNYYQLQFKATSDFSVRTEGIPNYQVQMVTVYVRGVYLPGFEIIPTLSMLAFAAAVAYRRLDEEEEDFENLLEANKLD